MKKMEQMTNTIISLFFGSLIPGLLMLIIQKKIGSVSQILEEKKEDEKTFNTIIIQSLLSLGKNDKAMFEALKTGRTNGNLDQAMQKYDEVEQKLNTYLIEKASRD